MSIIHELIKRIMPRTPATETLALNARVLNQVSKDLKKMISEGQIGAMDIRGIRNVSGGADEKIISDAIAAIDRVEKAGAIALKVVKGAMITDPEANIILNINSDIEFSISLLEKFTQMRVIFPEENAIKVTAKQDIALLSGVNKALSKLSCGDNAGRDADLIANQLAEIRGDEELKNFQKTHRDTARHLRDSGKEKAESLMPQYRQRIAQRAQDFAEGVTAQTTSNETSR